MPFPMNNPEDEDFNYKQMLMSQLNAPPPPPVDNGQNQLLASLTNSMNKLGTVGGRTADSGVVQRYADVLDKTKAMRDQQNMGQASKHQDILFKLAALKDKNIQNQNGIDLAENTRKQKLIDDERKRKQKLFDDENNFKHTSDLLDKKLAAAKEASESKVENKPSVAQQAVDRNFGKDYNDFVAQGGYAEVSKGLNEVRNVANELKHDDSLTGPIAGRVPDAVRAYTNPKAVDVRERLEDVVQRSMRQIMGAAFTENEGKRLLARAYNPALPASVNAERVERLANSLDQMAKAKLNAVKYYEENGSLNGFQGSTVNSIDQVMADIDKVKDNSPGMNDAYAAEPSKSPSSGPKVGDVVKGYQFMGGDPADKNSWVKKGQ